MKTPHGRVRIDDTSTFVDLGAPVDDASTDDTAVGKLPYANTDNAAESVNVKENRLLNRWPRAFARVIDLFFFMTLWFFCWYWVTGLSASKLASEDPFGFGLLVLTVLPCALFMEGITAAVFRNTPGKSIIGVCPVSTRGEWLGLSAYLRRSYAVWTEGLALGIVPLTFFSCLKQYKRVSGRREASYDERLYIRVRSSKWAGHRAAGLMLVCISVLVIVEWPNVDWMQRVAWEKEQTSARVAIATNAVESSVAPLHEKAPKTDDTSLVGNSGPIESGQGALEVGLALQGNSLPREPSELAATESAVSVAPRFADSALIETYWTNSISGLTVGLPGEFNRVEANGNSLAAFSHQQLDIAVRLHSPYEKTQSGSSGRELLLKQIFPQHDFIQAGQFEFGEITIFQYTSIEGEISAVVQLAEANRGSWVIESTFPLQLAGDSGLDELESLRFALWSTVR